MLAQTPFNLPEVSEEATQLGVWGVIIFFAFIALLVLYLVWKLPRPGHEDAYGSTPAMPHEKENGPER